MRRAPWSSALQVSHSTPHSAIAQGKVLCVCSPQYRLVFLLHNTCSLMKTTCKEKTTRYLSVIALDKFTIAGIKARIPHDISTTAMNIECSSPIRGIAALWPPRICNLRVPQDPASSRLLCQPPRRGGRRLSPPGTGSSTSTPAAYAPVAASPLNSLPVTSFLLLSLVIRNVNSVEGLLVPGGAGETREQLPRRGMYVVPSMESDSDQIPIVTVYMHDAWLADIYGMFF